ncbi:hypothetical protein TNCV_4179961 [Trichonephila clavipes]|nr:hypothetical protein TNCV_4179961 [Trichonephila clavipes]
MTLKHLPRSFEIAAIGMYACTTPTRHGLADMFENTGCFTDRSSNDGYSCNQVHFRIDGRVGNCRTERSIFRQLLKLSKKLMMILIMNVGYLSPYNRTITRPFQYRYKY